QRGDGNLDEARIADVLGADFEAVWEPAAKQIGAHRPRREQPVRGTLAVVGARELGQLLGELLLGVLPHHRLKPVACRLSLARRGIALDVAHNGISFTMRWRTDTVSVNALICLCHSPSCQSPCLAAGSGQDPRAWLKHSGGRATATLDRACCHA